MIYDEKIVRDSESSFLQSTYESSIMDEQNPFVEEIICLSPRATTAASNPMGAQVDATRAARTAQTVRPASLALQRTAVPARIGRHCMPPAPAPPQNVMLAGVLASRTRAPGQQVPPMYPRAGTPTAANRAQYSLDVRVNEGLTTDPRILYAQHQGHTTANPAQQAVQPPPEPARKLIDPARWVLGTPSRGAAEIAKAGVVAAAPAAQEPPGPMTVTNNKVDTIIENDQFNDPRWGQNLLINHARSARTAHENDSSRSDLQKADKMRIN